MPHARRMGLGGIHQRAVAELRLDVGVQVPLPVGPDPRLDEEPALGGVLLEVEEPLLRGPVRIGAEDDLEGELSFPGQGKDRDLEAVVDAVESDSLPTGPSWSFRTFAAHT